MKNNKGIKAKIVSWLCGKLTRHNTEWIERLDWNGDREISFVAETIREHPEIEVDKFVCYCGGFESNSYGMKVIHPPPWIRTF